MAEGTITNRGFALLKKPPLTTPAAEEVYYEAGGTQFHVHVCTTPDGKTHNWKCNSPYCASLIGSCPDHGGEEPIHVGREPWKR